MVLVRLYGHACFKVGEASGMAKILKAKGDKTPAAKLWRAFYENTKAKDLEFKSVRDLAIQILK